jgi:hypothetical protein
MLQNTKNKLVLSVLKKMREQGAPTTVSLDMTMSPEDRAIEGESDVEESDEAEVPNSMNKLFRRSKKPE